ncbi:hypothetical protein Sru01_18450 [Sphaerisporangium rufum]|uniref:Uncharacterized protein n=1 Tax=Sphaerisporangium rufum TaxID=1381558 RepID=A0A919R003_9ACTN|nr:hypothetical protein [Sphaerisporangium rufum]GII76863.1 hypothetical protein Sru01_18450 [Sphaerisporangium rufum]
MLINGVASSGPADLIVALAPDPYQVADTLQQDHPGWLILWAPWRRKFCAFSRDPHATSLVVEAVTPERLIALVRQADTEPRPSR